MLFDFIIEPVSILRYFASINQRDCRMTAGKRARSSVWRPRVRTGTVDRASGVIRRLTGRWRIRCRFVGDD